MTADNWTENRHLFFLATLVTSNESEVRSLIDAGVDVNKTDSFGQTALFYAVELQSNNKFVVRALIDAGADVNITDHFGRTALVYAAQQSNKESVVRALIDAGADVNITDKFGQTALVYATQQSNKESVVRALIDAGADVNITDKFGQTALVHAVQQSNNKSVVRALIDAGADVNITDNSGQTALVHAVQQSNKESVVRALIDAGADVNITDEDGETALFYAVQSNSNESVVRALIDAGAKVNICDDDVKTALFYAVQRANNESVVCKLIEAGVEVNLTDKNGETALFHAVQQTNNETVVRALIDAGADVNMTDKGGKTALIYAVQQSNNESVVRALIDTGADVKLADNNGETALFHAILGNDESVFRALIDAGADVNENYDYGQSSAVNNLVEVRTLLSKRGSNFGSEKTVFHLLLQLFQQGLQISDKTVRQHVLHETIKLLQLFPPAKNVAILRRIINIPDVDLNSPLHLWASLELPSPQDYTSNVTKDLTFEEFLQTILNYLLICGARVNNRNGKDQTPLHLCRTWIAVKLLLDAGANANDVDSSKASPFVSFAKTAWSVRGWHGGLYSDAANYSVIFPDVAEIEDPKSFWETVIDKGLDPWTADKEGESVLNVLIRQENFVFAKALVDLACKQGYTQSETFAVGLLTAICKDKSTRTKWKSILVFDILKSRKDLTTASEPLGLCCRNILETGILDNKIEEKPASAAIEISVSEGHATFDDGQPQSNKRRVDTSDHGKAAAFENLSVLCEIIKILRLYGADGNSCLDMVDTSDALKELLTKALDPNEVPVLIPWTSISKKYKVKLDKVARRQECNVIHKDFWCHKEHIGIGFYGDVLVGINEKDGREVAIKRILKARLQRPEDKREITNLTVLADCEQTVRYLHFFEDEIFSCVVLELMEGNLEEYLNDDYTFDARKSTQLCQDVVKGLKFLHAKGIVHRDLKPGNILYKTHPHLHLKIADFGLSRCVDSTTTTVYCTNAGTKCWMAPELLMSTHVDGGDHSKASDMFSCGLILHYILLAGKHPFSPCDCANKGKLQIAHETEANIMKGNLEGWDRSILEEASHLVKKMLEFDNDKRLSAEESLDHPLFWSNKKRVDVLVAVGNQSVLEYPRAGKSIALSAVETDLEKNFSTIVMHGTWNDSRYTNMSTIYADMTSTKKSRKYDTTTVVELVRFIRNAYAHVSESKRPTTIRKMLLEDFVFLKYFPHLVMEVYKVVTEHGWDQTVEEIKYAMKNK